MQHAALEGLSAKIDALAPSISATFDALWGEESLDGGMQVGLSQSVVASAAYPCRCKLRRGEMQSFIN